MMNKVVKNLRKAKTNLFLTMIVQGVSWAAVLLSSRPRVKIDEAGISETGSESL